MSTTFFDREKERVTLNRVIESGSSEFFLIYGRRGVGKSALLQDVLRKQRAPAMYYSATR